MATTKADIEKAYALIQQQEVNLMTTINDLIVDFKTKIEAIQADLPEAGSQSPVRQFLARVVSANMGPFGYDRENLLASYGINQPTPTE